MFALGDVFEFFPPTVDHKKYALCLGVDRFGFCQCIFLNSKNNFAGDIEFDCARFSMIPTSDTGITVVSLSTPQRYDDQRLLLFKAAGLGVLSRDVAFEILQFCEARYARKLTGQEKTLVVHRLTEYLTTYP
jgi:hypothetical protein